MRTTTRPKKQTGVSLDVDVYDALFSLPLLNKSAWMNEVIRKELVVQGMLEA